MVTYTPEEKIKIDELFKQGRTADEIGGYLGNNRLNKPSTIAREEANKETLKGKSQFMTDAKMLTGEFLNQIDVGGRLKEQMGEVVDLPKGIFNQYKSGIQRGAAKTQDPERNLAEKITGVGATTASTLSRMFVEEPVKFAVKSLFSKEQEDNMLQGISTLAEEAAKTDQVIKLMAKYDALDPKTKIALQDSFEWAEGLFDVAGGGTMWKLSKQGISKLDNAVTAIAKQADSALKQTAKQTDSAIKETVTLPNQTKIEFTDADFVDDVVAKQVQDTQLSETRRLAEEAAPDITMRERSIGLTPDDKAQILGKEGMMQDYIDVAKTRNVTKDAPGVAEYAGDFARKAADDMQIKLNSKGNEIGDARIRLADEVAPPAMIKEADNLFADQLGRLGLQLDEAGQVVRIEGKIKQVGSDADIKALQEFYDEFQIVKADPTLTNLIDYRNLVQQKINFSKRAADTSSAIEPTARVMRRKIKEIAEEVVGPEEALKLAEYTEFIKALDDIRSFTDRKAGGEYMLRVLESGRGGEARAIVNTIKKHTGIDLQDHATMMKLAVDNVGNASQKNLFRQEISKAGVDTARILSGDPTSLIGRGFEFAKDRVFDAEKVLIRAARGESGTTGMLDDLLGNPMKTADDVVSTSTARTLGLKQYSDDLVADVQKQILSGKKFDEKAGGWIDDGKAVVLDPDAVKKAHPKYDPDNPQILHAESSKIIEDLYDQALKQDTSGTVKMMGGGAGSGKSEVALVPLLPDESLILDGTLKSFDKAVKNIDKALAAGKKVEIHATYAPTKLAALFNRLRSRSVPSEILATTHAGFRETLPKLVKKYGDQIDIKVYSNSTFGKKGGVVDTDDLMGYLQSEIIPEKQVLNEAMFMERIINERGLDWTIANIKDIMK